MILSFRCRDTEGLYHGKSMRACPASLRRVALRKLTQLATVTRLADLRVPPGNRLEALRGARRGQHSIRVDDQWRVCFRWNDGHAHDVEIVDCH